MDENAENPRQDAGTEKRTVVPYCTAAGRTVATALTAHHRATKIAAMLENVRKGEVEVYNTVLLATANELLLAAMQTLQQSLGTFFASASDAKPEQNTRDEA
jgi:hypothetical protein